MTLNITVLNADAIYQSADYRLFDTRTRRPLDIPSTKAVALTFPNWRGFITYTGIGRVGSKDTSEIIRDWIRSSKVNLFEEIVEVLRSRASTWIQRIARGEKHTFVVAAFAGGEAQVAIISNFQKWHGLNLPAPAPSFFISKIKAKSRPQIIATGTTSAVTKDELRALRQLALQHPNDGARIRRAMASMNRQAARRAPELVSADCFVYSQAADGQGHGETFGRSRTEFSAIMDGEDISKLLHPFLEKMFGPEGATLVASTSSVSSTEASRLPQACILSLIDSTQTGFRLIELKMPEGRRAVPRATNRDGVIVGEGAPIWRGPSYPCAWPKPSTLVFLPHLGGAGGSARDINSSGRIVGESNAADHASHACVWTFKYGCQDIGRTIGKHSSAVRSNEVGDSVGWVSIHPTEGGQQHFRPVIWKENTEAIVLGKVAGDWAEAVDVNAQGAVLVRVHKGMQVFAVIWDHELIHMVGYPGANCVSFWPHRLTDDGSVIGLAIEANGNRLSAIRQSSGAWERLFEPALGREFTATNSKGMIAGFEKTEDYMIAWFKRPNENITYLQGFKHHNHRPTAVSEDGRILGFASADNCTHPIMWTSN
ncbi:MAG: hypothetical protein IT539_00585 [Bradyrhizobiaceae bacterium]|nr:hypothetical protein [Bradyrhizobiaceae bacterium]